MATGVGFSPRALASAISASLSCSRPARRRATCGLSAAGGATRSRRWNVPPLAAARSATIALVIPPAAPVTTKTPSRSSRIAGEGVTGRTSRPNRPARPGAPADLDDAGVGERLGDERVGDLGVARFVPEVDDLHEGVAALALVGLDEPLDGPAQRRGGPLLAEPEEPAEARRGDEERAGRGDALVQDAHRRREVLHDPAGRLAEGVDRQLLEARFRVERRQPEDAGDGPLAEPPAQRLLNRRSGRAHVELEHRRAERRELPREGLLARAPCDDDAHARSQADAGRLAQVERRTQDGHGDAPGRLVRVGERIRLRCVRRRGCGRGRGRRERAGTGESGDGRGQGRRRREVRPIGADEADDVAQGREVAEPQALDPRNGPLLAHGGEGLGLLHGVDAEVGLEVEVEVQQVGRIAGLLGDDRDDPGGDRIGTGAVSGG